MPYGLEEPFSPNVIEFRVARLLVEVSDMVEAGTYDVKAIGLKVRALGNQVNPRCLRIRSTSCRRCSG